MDERPLRPWKTLSRRSILDQGRFLRVESHAVGLPDGRVISDWPWIITPDAVIVLAMTAQEHFLCFRQTKYAVEGTSLAPVGGMLEPDENPFEAAKRELREETGYESPDWVELGNYVVGPNRGIGTMHLYLAKNAREVCEPSSDDLEDQQLHLLNRSELELAFISGEFKVLAWTAAVAMALCHLNRETA